MFNKRKKAQQQAIHDAWTSQQKQFDEAIKQADQIDDPAAKVLAFRKIRNDISNQLFGESMDVAKEASNKGLNTLVAGTGSVFGGTLVAAHFLTGPVGWVTLPFTLGGYLGTIALSKKRRKNVAMKLEQAASAHTSYLRAQMDYLGVMESKTVADNVEKISTSPLKEKVIALPGISEVFSEAAAKIIAEKEAAEAEAKAAPPVPAEKPAARPKRDPKYKDIGQSGL